MKLFNIFSSIAAITLLISSFSAQASIQQEIMRSRKRGSGGVETQWTLVDWLKQRNAAALADQWLALNSSTSWLDVSMGAAGQRYRLKSNNGTLSSSQNLTAQTYGLEVSVSILVLRGEYEKTENKREEYGGSAGLRLLGSSSRSTSLTANYGIHVRHDLVDLEQWQNQYLEGQLQLYIVKDFGLHGSYRYYFPADSNLGNRLEGIRASAGLFADISVLRITGSYFQEPLKITRSGVVDKEDRDGFDVGVRLMF